MATYDTNEMWSDEKNDFKEPPNLCILLREMYE